MSGFFGSEAFNLRTYSASGRMPRRTRINPWSKYSDAGIHYGRPGEDLSRTIVFEVGASEPHDQLVDDTRQWLLGARGDVQLIILVDIQEDLNALKRHRQTQEYRERFHALVVEYAHPDIIDQLELRDDYGVYDFLEDSACEDYKDLKADINHIDFVGPIEVTLELWELKGDLPTKRSSHRVLPSGDNHVPIRFSDVVPQHRVDAGHDSVTQLDLTLYRTYLERGARDLAFWRALDILRPNRTKSETE